MITQIGTQQDSINNYKNCSHQIQHYTQQLAKDSSLQLRDLNNYSSEDVTQTRDRKEAARERLNMTSRKAWTSSGRRGLRPGGERCDKEIQKSGAASSGE